MSTAKNRMEVVLGDITTMAIDAVVNAANSALAGGGGVDGAIHQAAGPALYEACRALGGCPTGEVRLTAGFGMPARFIIHTVGPVWHGGGEGEPELLADCYRAALYMAADEKARTVAFPAISCGVYGYPKEAAARIAVQTVAGALPLCPGIEMVTLVAYDPEMAEIYTTLIAELPD